jgi:hypothetical protein
MNRDLDSGSHAPCSKQAYVGTNEAFKADLFFAFLKVVKNYNVPES